MHVIIILWIPYTGNEARGISKLVQRHADLQYILPMAGFTQSLKYAQDAPQ